MKKETFVIKENGLYIVATPIGNLMDITLRALEVLKHVDIIACEDTRVTQKLLNNYHITNKKLFSYANHNLKIGTKKILQYLINNLSVALVSDAGTPIISDPGAELVHQCYKNNIKVTTIPGASSIIAALTLSGLINKDFYFGGFLENKAGELQKQLLKIKSFNSTLIYFVAASKLLKVNQILLNIFNEKQPLIIVREITKIYEEVIYTTTATLPHLLEQRKVLGEVVLIIPNNIKENKPSTQELTFLLKDKLQILSLKDTTNFIINYYKQQNVTLSKKEIYNLALKIKNDS